MFSLNKKFDEMIEETHHCGFNGRVDCEKGGDCQGIKKLYTKEILSLMEEIEDMLIGFNDRGIVHYVENTYYGKGLKSPPPYAKCDNCGFEAKGKKAEDMMFGHKNCPKPNGYYIKQNFTVEDWQKFKKGLTKSHIR